MIWRKNNKTAYEEEWEEYEETDDFEDSKEPRLSKERRTYNRLRSNVLRQILLTVGAMLMVVVLAVSMSIAWFTNVSKTSDMQFTTSAWGFDKEKIAVAATNPKIFPGKSGVIPLSIDNSKGDTDLNAMVTVDKSTMSIEEDEAEPLEMPELGLPNIDDELAKRIYFYVDTSKTYLYEQVAEEAIEPENGDDTPESNSETVSRVYINSVDGYCYSVARGGKLSLSEEYSNDVHLKWEWVNTVQGYYFRGTVSENGAVVGEYLRPVTYTTADYAVSYNDETGQLASVNGISKTEFIAQLTASDGYEGIVDAKSAESYVAADEKIYYKIFANEDGEGVWLYLCTKEEIDEENAIDNIIGAERVIAAKVIITAASIEHTEKVVGSAEELTDALNSSADADNVIELSTDISVSEPICLHEGRNKLIDLNSHSITYTGTETAYSLVSVPAGSTLSLLNGTLIGNGSKSGNVSKTDTIAVQCSGGTASISAITVKNVDTAVAVDDRLTADSVVRITGCTFDTTSTAIMVRGNGDASAVKTKVIIEDCRISSEYIGLCGNGSDDQWGTEVFLINDVIEGFWAGIYCPQRQSQMTIVNCTVTGYTGIAVKGGCVELYNSTVTGTGSYAEARTSRSGWTDTGDALYVEAAYDWSATAIVRGTGNTLNSTHGYSVQLYNADGKGPGMLLVEGGTFEYGKGQSNVGEFGTLTMPQESSAEEEG